jgi:hypothetical protein
MKDVLLWIAPNIGPILTAIGLFLTFWALRKNHDWNRRNFSTSLVSKWNDETSVHRKAIEAIRPGLIDLDTKQNKVVELTKTDASNIYSANPESQEWQLRFHFIELLNHFESIASAYRNAVGDKQIIEESLRSPLVRWHDILRNFIEVVKTHRGYEPWEPYTTVVAHWKQTPFRPRPYTG